GEVQRRAALGRRSREIAGFELHQDLPRAYAGTALHVQGLHRRRHLRGDGRLLTGIQEPVGPDRAPNLRLQHGRHVNGDDGLGVFFLLAAAAREQRSRQHHADDGPCHDQNGPVRVCRSARDTRYRVSASSAALRAWTSVFWPSTTSRIVDSPAWYRSTSRRRLSEARSTMRRRLSVEVLAISVSLYFE